ncbi:hypothetical protein KCTC52924_00417 [Arenibacter antarcticus]
MKINSFVALLILSVGLHSCNTETPAYERLTTSKEGAQVFLAKGGSEYHYLNTYSREDQTVSAPDSIKFNAGFGALGLPANPINVKLTQNLNAIDSINEIREMNGEAPYLPFPENAYDINQLNLDIPSRSEYSNYATLKYYPEKFDFDNNYLLAISVDDASGYAINPEKRTIFFAVSEVKIIKPGIDLTIMSYGIGSGNKNMQSLAVDINEYNPDLLIVREIDRNTTRSGPSDLPEILSSLIDMPHYIYANGLNYQGGEYGTAIFSKFPINSSSTAMLPTYVSEKGPLGIINVQINEQEQLIFAGTHLNAIEDRRITQTPVLVDSMNNYKSIPVILGGNFNTPPGTGDPYQLLSDQFSFPCTSCPPNFPADNPASYTDFIMFSHPERFDIINYRVGVTSASRHLPVILKVRLEFE